MREGPVAGILSAGVPFSKGTIVGFGVTVGVDVRVFMVTCGDVGVGVISS